MIHPVRLRIRWADGVREMMPLEPKPKPLALPVNDAAQAKVAAALKRMGLVAGETDPDGWTHYDRKPEPARKPKPAPHVCPPCPSCIDCNHPTGRLWTWHAFDGTSVTACLRCRRLVDVLDPSARSEVV